MNQETYNEAAKINAAITRKIDIVKGLQKREFYLNQLEDSEISVIIHNNAVTFSTKRLLLAISREIAFVKADLHILQTQLREL